MMMLTNLEVRVSSWHLLSVMDGVEAVKAD